MTAHCVRFERRDDELISRVLAIKRELAVRESFTVDPANADALNSHCSVRSSTVVRGKL